MTLVIVVQARCWQCPSCRFSETFGFSFDNHLRPPRQSAAFADAMSPNDAAQDTQLYYCPDPVADRGPARFTDYHSFENTPLVIDNGSTEIRAGWATEQDPRIATENVVAKYRDRKINKVIMLAGSQVYTDSASRQAARSPFDTDIIYSFDAMVRLASETSFDFLR